MKRFLIVSLFLLTASAILQAQQVPDSLRRLKVVDTLTKQERNTRVPVLLRSELDSMIALHLASLPVITEETIVDDPEKISIWPWVSGAALTGILVLLYLLWRYQRRSNRHLVRLYRQIQYLDTQVAGTASRAPASETGPKKKMSVAATEKELAALKEELARLGREKQGVEMMLEEYRQVKHDYEALKQQMMEAYKVRHYPGFSRENTETEILKSLVVTEKSVAQYAYDHFLRPVLQLTDANKNHPAKISEEDRQKIADYLVSLGLLYSEYLYLRIGELSIGGKMVERIGALRKGNGVDPQLLKELNTEHGSRALALRMALDKMGIRKLSYPVFEETNLNLS